MHIGIDLGGTKIEILLLDAHGKEHLRKRVATPKGQYAATLQAIKQLVDTADRWLRLNTVIPAEYVERRGWECRRITHRSSR